MDDTNIFTPTSLDDFVFANHRTEKTLRAIVSKDIPVPDAGTTGLLLYGAYGTGKTTLAKMLISGANVLLLDEPSNDLDVETLRSLEEALLEFAGSVMVISHDRWFLDRIATHILACEGDSQWVFFDGNYQEYEADKKRRLGEEGAKPKRVRYKALK